MTYTEEQLNSFTDETIISVFKPRLDAFDKEVSNWEHADILYCSLYDEVIEGRLSQEDKDAWVKEWKEGLIDGLDGLETFEAILEEHDYLREDVGCWSCGKDEFVDECCIYLFRYMFDSCFTNDFIEFINQADEAEVERCLKS